MTAGEAPPSDGTYVAVLADKYVRRGLKRYGGNCTEHVLVLDGHGQWKAVAVGSLRAEPLPRCAAVPLSVLGLVDVTVWASCSGVLAHLERTNLGTLLELESRLGKVPQDTKEAVLNLAVPFTRVGPGELRIPELEDLWDFLERKDGPGDPDGSRAAAAAAQLPQAYAHRRLPILWTAAGAYILLCEVLRTAAATGAGALPPKFSKSREALRGWLGKAGGHLEQLTESVAATPAEDAAAVLRTSMEFRRAVADLATSSTHVNDLLRMCVDAERQELWKLRIRTLDEPHLMDEVLEALVSANPIVAPVFDTTGGRNLAEALAACNLRQGTASVPLIVTTDGDVQDVSGYTIPLEFTATAFEPSLLKKRARQLAQVHPRGLSLALFQDMCVGALRQQVGMDLDNHGRGAIDTVQLRVDLELLGRREDHDAQKALHDHVALIEHVVQSEPFPTDEKLFAAAFPERRQHFIERLKDLAKKLSEAAGQPSTVTATSNAFSLLEQFTREVPRRTGAEVLQCSASGKLRALLIDDQCDVVEHRLRQCSPWKYDYGSAAEADEVEPCLSDVIEVTSVQPDVKDSRAHPVTWLNGRLVELAETQGHVFDIVLLDMRLGEPPGEYPHGYYVADAVRRQFPEVPTIMLSAYDDPGSIERAIRHGIASHVSKQHYEKLPRRAVECIRGPARLLEWEGIKGLVKFRDESEGGGAAHNDRWRFAVWKSTGAGAPAIITTKTLTGGIGGAETVLARVAYSEEEATTGGERYVVKIGDHLQMLLEQERYRRFIRPHIGNEVGRIDGHLVRLGDGESAIAYTFASRGRRGISPSRDVVTLEKWILESLDRGVNERSGIQTLVKDVLCRMTAQLHQVALRTHGCGDGNVAERGGPDFDFPNAAFDESKAAADSYVRRMPPEETWEVADWKSAGAPDMCQATVVEVESAESGERFIKALAKPANGDKSVLMRIDLVGEAADFVARFRSLRPAQSLGFSTRTGEAGDRKSERDHWVTLWTWSPHEAQGTIDVTSELRNPTLSALLWQLGLTGAALTDLTAQGDAVVALRTLLTSGPYAMMLDKGGGDIGVVHGDLNLGNVMVDETTGTPYAWFIDFARSRRDRIVIDFTQFEADCTVRLVPRVVFEASRRGSKDEQYPKPREKPPGAAEVAGWVTQHWAECERQSRGLRPRFWSKSWQWVTQHWVGWARRSRGLQPRLFRKSWQLEALASLGAQCRHAALGSRRVTFGGYMASLALQFLITHKIQCKKWRRSSAAVRDLEAEAAANTRVVPAKSASPSQELRDNREKREIARMQAELALILAFRAAALALDTMPPAVQGGG